MKLKPETLSRIDEVITHYPVKRSAVLPLLHLIQEDVGWISPEATEWVAAKLSLQPINVLEVVTFYPMFRQKPIGRRHIKVCRTLSCALLGGYTTFSAFSLQTLNLARSGDWLAAGLNVMLSVALCLLAVWLGHLLAQAMAR